jgi:deoxyribose-phosphate aldolase
LSKKSNVATACVKPYAIPLTKEIIKGSDVGICAVIGFPAGKIITTNIKCAEADKACRNIGHDFKAEIDMVVNVGKVLGGDWPYVTHEIRVVNDIVTSHNAILKLILENDYLSATEITQLCHTCTHLKVAFVKT